MESVDASHGTAQIRRFTLNGTIPTGGYDWFSGEVVAWGMRNAVGIALSQDGSKLWTVENSADDLTYTQNSQQIDVHFVSFFPISIYFNRIGTNLLLSRFLG
jgi:hypothetical protein